MALARKISDVAMFCHMDEAGKAQSTILVVSSDGRLFAFDGCLDGTQKTADWVEFPLLPQGVLPQTETK